MSTRRQFRPGLPGKLANETFNWAKDGIVEMKGEGMAKRRVRWPLLLVASSLFVLAFVRCDNRKATSGYNPVFHCDAYDIWPDSIDFHSGIVLRASGDSLLQIRADGITLREVSLKKPQGKMSVHTGIGIFDALFMLESVEPENTNYTSLMPYCLYLNPLSGNDGIRVLESREKNGYIVPMDTRLYQWPVINDNPQWLLAATELYKVTGNKRWLEKVGSVAEKVVREDCRVAYNAVTGLVGGMPRHIALIDDGLPEWFEPVDLFNSASLTVNVAYWGALKGLESITSEMARKNEKSHLPEVTIDSEKLRNAILRRLWIPDAGMLGALCYGYPLCPMSLKASDNLGQSLAIVAGMLSAPMGNAIIAKTPTESTGVDSFSPRWNAGENIGTISDINLAMWAVAASRTDNPERYNAAIGALLYRDADCLICGRQDGAFNRKLSALVLRGFLGMHFACDGIRFTPSVPLGMPGEKRVESLEYRKSILDITVRGTGNVVTSFSIDGQAAAPFFPASMEGRHKVEITLSDQPGEEAVAGAGSTGVMPMSPVVEWVDSCNAMVMASVEDGNAMGHDVRSGSKSRFQVYANGVMTEELSMHNYEFNNASFNKTAAIQIVSVEGDGKLTGFSSKPHLYIPPGNEIVVGLPDWAVPGTRIIKDKSIASQFVETNRWKNRVLRVEFEVDREGEYAFDAHYLYGLGIVNQRRRTALRSVAVDGDNVGIWVFPQLCAPRRERDSSDYWQTLASYTNPLKVHLAPGCHILEMKLYQPSPVYIDPTGNVVLSDYIRIVYLHS